jgi:hypothetical protein
MPVKASSALLSITLALFGSVADAAAKGETPPLGTVYNSRELTRINFDCKFIDNRGEIALQPTDSIECEFRVVSLRMPTAETRKNELAKNDQDTESFLREELPRRPFTEVRKKICGNAEERAFQDRLRKRAVGNKYASALLPDLERGQRAYDRLCSCADKTCFLNSWRALALQRAQEKAETCEISSYTWRSISPRR